MRMLRVALTGGIGTGKTYVIRLLRDRAVPTIDADQLARDAVQPDQPGAAALRARFGAEVFHPDGSLDRPRLGTIIFDDREARADLEAIVHPPVRRAIAAWFQRCADDGQTPFAVADIPLLFETGRAAEFDRVVVVACTPDTQVRRVVERDALPEADARKRLAAQLPIAGKMAAADIVIQTDGSFADTERQVNELCRTLRADG